MKIVFKNILLYSFFISVVLLPFSIAVSNIFLFISIILSFFGFSKKEINILSKNKVYLLILLTTFYYYFIQIVKYNNINNLNLKILLLVLIPIVILKIKKTVNFFNIVVITNFTVLLYFIYRLSVFYYYFRYFPVNQGEIVNFIIPIDRPLYGFLLTISTILLIFKNLKTFNKIFILLFLINVTTIFFISSRYGMVSLITTILILIYDLSFNKKKRYFVLIATSILMLISISTLLNNRFNYGDNNISLKKIINEEPRVIIWECYYESTTYSIESVLFGVINQEQLNDKMSQCYLNKIKKDNLKRDFFINKKYHTHNQFFDFFLIGGIILIILWITIFYKLIILNKYNLLKFSLIISLLIFMLVDNPFSRHFTSFFFSIIISFLIFNNYKFKGL